jgi:ribonuclease HII
MKKWVIGIDEVGRGPLAGPVTLCAVMMKVADYKKFQATQQFLGLKDSKKLSKEKREVWRKNLVGWKKKGNLKFALSSSQNSVIDSKGLSFAIRVALARCLLKLNANPKDSLILLDGGLKAPAHFLFQRTIIKGDEKEPIISLASIIAKTTRDRRMNLLGELFLPYDFVANKGYGTKKHLIAIKVHGTCAIHRKSFLKHLS